MVYMENDACPEKKDFLRRVEDNQHCTTAHHETCNILKYAFYIWQLPGLLNFALWPLTLVVRDVAQRAVDGGEVGFAHIEEVRAHAAH